MEILACWINRTNIKFTRCLFSGCDNEILYFNHFLFSYHLMLLSNVPIIPSVLVLIILFFLEISLLTKFLSLSYS